MTDLNSINLEKLEPEERKRLLHLIEEKKRRDQYEKLRTFEPYPWQKELADCSANHGQILAMCFGSDSPVWMADGTVKRIADVAVGDMVLAWDEAADEAVPSRVQAVHERFAEDVHWANYGRSAKNGFFVTGNHGFVTTTGKHKPIKDFAYHEQCRIANQIGKVSAGGEPTQADLDIAWLVGAWLGDGCYNKQNGTIRITNIDADVITKLETICDRFGHHVRHFKDEEHFISGPGKGQNVLINALREYGVLDCKRIDKRIPEKLLYAPEPVIRELIDGLMCTDGHSAEGSFRFYNTSEKLVHQLRFLLLRLGIVASVQARESAKAEHNTCYRLVITGNEYLQKLGDITSKPIRLVDRKTSTAKGRHLRLSEELYPQKVHCITVEHPDHLFVVDGFIVENCANQIGKMVRATEPVLTPVGWVKIADLSVGDEVMDPDGGVGRVTGYYPQGKKAMYRVHFNDGTYVDCGAEHLWRCKSPERRFRKAIRGKPCTDYGQWEVKSTQEILDHVGSDPKAPRRYSIPAVQELDYPYAESLPIAPYLLGLLIGDGGLSTDSVIISSADDEILDYCRAQAPEYGCELKHKSRYDYSFSSKERTARGYGSNRLRDALAELGVVGHKSYTKSVPELYKHASPAVRLAVLQGLMDSDGSTTGRSSEFCSVSEQLAQDVADLARSLGVTAVIKQKRTSWTYKGEKKYSTAFRVCLWATETPLFRLTRKLERQDRSASRNSNELVIQRIEDLHEEAEAVCISVSTQNRVYVVSNYKVTHNTTGGAWVVSCHLTGLYPDDWEGHKFDRPIQAWACGVSNETTRDILQFNLLGPPGNKDDEGSMFIPRDCIHSTVRKPQVPNAYQTVYIKHYGPNGKPDGYSRVDFKAYEQGETKFYGRSMDLIWLDEQPDSNIYTQCITRTVATGGLTMMTFTPEDGVTPTVQQFMYDKQLGQYLIRATWDDAPHLDEERKQQLLAQYPPHERRMRAEGLPVFGKGLVFPVSDDDLIHEPFDIPDHWARIAGIDFGWDHPMAMAWLAWDRDTDTVYVYHVHKERLQTPQMYAPKVRHVTPWIPVVWPHDGNKNNPGNEGAITTADLFRREGLMMTPDHFRNPLAPGEKGAGNIKREPGITAMLQAMESGQFKVFSTCTEWFQEKQMYYRGDDGQIVDLNDDLMSATRYAFQSRGKYAKTKPESDAFSRYMGKPLPAKQAV